MTFFVLDENPVRSANMMCWLDCESAAFDGARIIVSAIKEQGGDIDDLPFQSIDGHPMVRWAVVSRENARWLYRNTRAAAIKWGKDAEMKDYPKLMKDLNEIAGVIDSRCALSNEMVGQSTLFGNFYIDGDALVPLSVSDSSVIKSNRAYYEQTRRYLTWGDVDPKNIYGERGEEE